MFDDAGAIAEYMSARYSISEWDVGDSAAIGRSGELVLTVYYRADTRDWRLWVRRGANVTTHRVRTAAQLDAIMASVG